MPKKLIPTDHAALCGNEIAESNIMKIDKFEEHQRIKLLFNIYRQRLAE